LHSPHQVSSWIYLGEVEDQNVAANKTLDNSSTEDLAEAQMNARLKLSRNSDLISTRPMP